MPNLILGSERLEVERSVFLGGLLGEKSKVWCFIFPKGLSLFERFWGYVNILI